MECEVRWALGSTFNKARRCDGIPVEFHSKNNKRYVSLNMSVNLEDPAVATGLEKVNLHPSSQGAVLKNQTIALISQASKVMLKILHARLQRYVNQELPDV